jgi:oxaloacetate decarboxylase alpha subunit/pyruvate carboxylase subunit B
MGVYGNTPIPVDPEFRLQITGSREEKPYDTSKYQKQPNPLFAEFGNARLAVNEKEELLLELFPNVAEKFLKDRIIARYMDAIRKEQDKKRKAIEEEKRKYEMLSNEEKRERLINGLFNAW